MGKGHPVTPEDFRRPAPIGLASTRKPAGQKYEKIRQRLIRIFTCRGCYEAEELADTTINRVMLKLPQISEKYVGEPALYFCGVADKIHLEWLRQQKKVQKLELTETDSYGKSEPKSDSEYECLEECLRTLSTDDRELIVSYYKEEKKAKIELRRALAERLGVSPSTLQVKTCRIRANLQKCVQNCVGRKKS